MNQLTLAEDTAIATGAFAQSTVVPIDNEPTINTLVAGSAVPVKFSVGGDRGLAVVAPGYPASRQVTCPGDAPAAAVEELTNASGGSNLRYDTATGRYIYVWKTEKAWAGTCRSLNVRLSDGTNHTATFIFAK